MPIKQLSIICSFLLFFNASEALAETELGLDTICAPIIDLTVTYDPPSKSLYIDWFDPDSCEYNLSIYSDGGDTLMDTTGCKTIIGSIKSCICDTLTIEVIKICSNVDQSTPVSKRIFCCPGCASNPFENISDSLNMYKKPPSVGGIVALTDNCLSPPDICGLISNDPNHAMAAIDCDNGGVDNQTECNSGYNPLDPSDDCILADSLGICMIIGGDPNHPLSTMDCDNGGIINLIECINGGNPSDPSDDSYVLLHPKVILSGCYNSTLMNDDLRIQGQLPINHPYNMTPWSCAGSETVAPSIFTTTGSNAIVDWVLVELRDKTNPAIILKRRAALLQADADVVDIDGISPLTFSGYSPDDYYVAVKHRNHLGVMTAFPIALNSITPTVMDYRIIPTYGTDAQMLIGSGSDYALWAGDTNSDGVINSSDRSATWNYRNQTGYLWSDVNLDGVINAADRSTVWNNRNRFAQLP